MSWLFGKKKQQKDFPTDEEQSSSEPGEGYIFVEKHSSQSPGYSGTSDVPSYPGSGLYPHIGGTGIYSTALPTNLPKENNQGDAVHYLSQVPFKLCKRLEVHINNDFEIDVLRISEILSFIERIQDRNFDYDFSIEKGVIAEMNSRDQ